MGSHRIGSQIVLFVEDTLCKSVIRGCVWGCSQWSQNEVYKVVIEMCVKVWCIVAVHLDLGLGLAYCKEPNVQKTFIVLIDIQLLYFDTLILLIEFGGEINDTSTDLYFLAIYCFYAEDESNTFISCIKYELDSKIMLNTLEDAFTHLQSSSIKDLSS